MWLEVLPSAGIIFAAMAIPHFSAYVINKIAVGNMYRKSLGTEDLRRSYLRDWRITKNPYKAASLEAIPDN